jgi:hypothetical protein
MIKRVAKSEENMIKRVAKSEENYQAVHATSLRYLFCMLEERQNGQWLNVAICRHKVCKHFNDTDVGIKCTCPTSIYYIGAVKRLNKDELNRVKTELRQGKAIEDVL